MSFRLRFYQYERTSYANGPRLETREPIGAAIDDEAVVRLANHV